jgi:predicted protein tyrosine phosphatase
MIHVCSLARLHQTVETSGARHLVTVMKDISLVGRPANVRPENHLHIGIDDITCPMEGYSHPGEEHVARLLQFVGAWDRSSPLVIHCYAGISRSTASAFATACAVNPQRDELAIARELRRVSPTAMPNSLIVAHADRLLGRGGRMIEAIDAIGLGELAFEADPFRLEVK